MVDPLETVWWPVTVKNDALHDEKGWLLLGAYQMLKDEGSLCIE